MSDAVVVGVDVGGSNVRAATLRADGSIVDRARAPATFAAADAVLDTIVELVDGLSTELPVGVGFAGGVTTSGTVAVSPNLAIEDFPLRERLSASLQRRVLVVNDASAAMWAEHRIGAAAGYDDAVLLTLGTGLGGGVVTGGRLVSGATGLAGELGHMTIDVDGPMCACGNQGCLEALVSGTAMGLPGRSSVEVVAAARAGHEDAAAHLIAVGGWLGIGVASLVAVLDPGVVVIGGGAGAAAFDLLVEPARASMLAHLFGRSRRAAPPLVVAELGDDAGVVGAGLLALDATPGRSTR